MKNFRLVIIPALTLFIGILHLLPRKAGLPDCFGFDQLRYLSETFTWLWILAFLALAISFSLAPLDKIPGRLNSKIFLLAPALLWPALLFFLHTSAPLLGDGLDRIYSLHSGLLPTLRNQPAPLDLILHWLLFSALKSRTHSDFLTYNLLSYGAGIFYLAMILISGRKLFSDKSDRIFWLLILLSQGYIQLFAGYAENYSFLPGLFLSWILGAKETERGKTWPILVSQSLLILFHFFCILLLPATIYLLLARSEKKSRVSATGLTLAGLLFSGLALFLVWRYYRGIAIFLAPGKIFSPNHLLDFFNHQILASPALLLLVLGFAIKNGKLALTKPERTGLLGILILLIFFFVLRPVIGAMRDWDLFAIPAMLYTPALLVYLFPRLKPERNFLARFGILVFLVSSFHTGAWLWVNHSEKIMITRIQFHLDENQEPERWASAYGYMTVGKYYLATARLEESRRALEKSVQIHPSYSQNRLALGIQLWALGKYLEAIFQVEQAHEINPTNPGIKKTLSRFYLEYAQTLSAQNKKAEAEKYLQKLSELDSESLNQK